MVDCQPEYAGYLAHKFCDQDNLRMLISQKINAAEVSRAANIANKVPFHDMTALRRHVIDPIKIRMLSCEWAWVLAYSAAVIVLKWVDQITMPIDQATDVFNIIIKKEREGKAGIGDYFVAGDVNDRLLGSLQKHRLKALRARCSILGLKQL